MIKIRVKDELDPDDVFDDSDDAFKLDYYKSIWDVRDLLTNAPLSALTVKAYKDTDNNYVVWNQAGQTTNPAIIKYFPAGTWVVDFTRTEYTDMSVTLTASADKDYSTSAPSINNVNTWTTATPYVVGNHVKQGSTVYRCTIR